MGVELSVCAGVDVVAVVVVTEARASGVGVRCVLLV